MDHLRGGSTKTVLAVEAQTYAERSPRFIDEKAEAQGKQGFVQDQVVTCRQSQT